VGGGKGEKEKQANTFNASDMHPSSSAGLPRKRERESPFLRDAPPQRMGKKKRKKRGRDRGDRMGTGLPDPNCDIADNPLRREGKKGGNTNGSVAVACLGGKRGREEKKKRKGKERVRPPNHRAASIIFDRKLAEDTEQERMERSTLLSIRRKHDRGRRGGRRKKKGGKERKEGGKGCLAVVAPFAASIVLAAEK